MATQALYNKWRGQTFADILGQEHITVALQNQIKAGRVGHAYLFTGVRGTGKTSTARIMAKAVNCIGDTVMPPCNDCRICRSITRGASLDLIEIDGASNRGIDEIRELRDRVGFSPNECRYKVYVIDEVHMLTNEAFNALLKTLEEPPAHVIFILCTTEPHRLPDTVLSRCQRYDFRRGSVALVAGKLARICAQEGIGVAPDALEFIARRAEGSFRDAESLLDQLASFGVECVTLEQVQRVLGSVPLALISEMLGALVARDTAAGLGAINQAIEDGAEPRQFLGEILDHLRGLLLIAVGSEESLRGLSEEAIAEMRGVLASGEVDVPLLVEAIKLFNRAADGLRSAVRPQLPLEVAFVEAVLASAERAGASVPPVGAGRSAASLRSAPSPSVAATSPAVRGSAGVKAASAVCEERDAGYRETPEGADQPQAEAVPAEARPTGDATDSEAPGEQAPVGGDTPPLSLEWVKGNWRQIVLRIRPLSPQVQALVNSAEPVKVQGNTITLGCVNALVCDKLLADKKRDLVEQVASQVLRTPCRINCVVSPPEDRQVSEGDPESPPPTDLFSGAKPSHDVREELLSHPAVAELKKLGGRVSSVRLYDEAEEDSDG